MKYMRINHYSYSKYIGTEISWHRTMS